MRHLRMFVTLAMASGLVLAASSVEAALPVSSVAFSANASASTMMRVDQTTVITTAATSDVQPRTELQGGRTFAGFAVHSKSGHLLVAAFLPKGFTLAAGADFVYAGSPQRSVRLSPGTYRLSLFSDGAATLKLPFKGGRPRISASRTAAPPLQVSWQDMGSGAVNSATTAIKLGRSSALGIGQFSRYSGPNHATVGFCVRLPGSRCVAIADEDASGGGSSLGPGESSNFTHYFASRSFEPATYHATTQATDVGLVLSRYAFFVALV